MKAPHALHWCRCYPPNPARWVSITYRVIGDPQRREGTLVSCKDCGATWSKEDMTTTNESTTERRRSPRITRLEEFIAEKAGTCQLRSWNELVEPVTMPPELYPALLTGRPELLTKVPGRALTAEECKSVFDLLSVLIRTNIALQEHAQLVAQSVDTWADAFKQLERVGRSVQDFANFRSPGDPG